MSDKLEFVITRRIASERSGGTKIGHIFWDGTEWRSGVKHAYLYKSLEHAELAQDDILGGDRMGALCVPRCEVI